MKIKEYYNKIRKLFNDNRKAIYICSLISTFLFSFYNRIIGIIKESIWHEAISIYYLLLVIVKGLLVFYFYHSKTREKEIIVFKTVKSLLILLNILLIIPIMLLVYNKRIVEMTLIPSIAIALYVTVKTIVFITRFIKKRHQQDVIIDELRTVDIIDVVVSILTLQNTLIAVNSNGFDKGLYYLTIISSIAGLFVNIYLSMKLKYKYK